MISRTCITLLAAASLVTGCGGMDSVKKVWPFEGGSGQSRGPANATEYQCSGGKRFYVRMLDNGASAWLIYPDREVSLAKASGAGQRYTNGVAVLDLSSGEATLNDGAAINYSGCKAVTSK